MWRRDFALAGSGCSYYELQGLKRQREGNWGGEGSEHCLCRDCGDKTRWRGLDGDIGLQGGRQVRDAGELGFVDWILGWGVVSIEGLNTGAKRRWD